MRSAWTTLLAGAVAILAAAAVAAMVPQHRRTTQLLIGLEEQVNLARESLRSLHPVVNSLSHDVHQLRQSVAELQHAQLADGTGRPDYALASVGGRVVGTSALLPGPLQLLQHAARWFPALLSPADQVRSVYTMRRWYPALPQTSTGYNHVLTSYTVLLQYVLSPHIAPGRCLPLLLNGHVDVKLSQPLLMDSISYEHVPPALVHGNSSAPSVLTLYGALGRAGLVDRAALLGSAAYDAHGPPLQTFMMSSGSPIDHVRVVAVPERTVSCLYRLRVHGIPASS